MYKEFEKMKSCFVIQPFDKDKFDKRFIDVYKPAIEAAGLVAYRVDNDLGARVPIEQIENNIRDSVLCFAEITNDNPNVWYELGFAFASGKDVIMVCETERVKFPFDIQHRSIITYKSSSPSDFTELQEKITDKINAYISTNTQAEKISIAPIKDMQGLNSFQIALLMFIFQRSIYHDSGIPSHSLVNEMNKAGFNELATAVGIKTLTKMEMIEIVDTEDDYNRGDYYKACCITQKGENWVLTNQDKFEFGQTQPTITPPF